MTGYLVIPIVGLAAAALLWIGRWAKRRGGAGLVGNPAVDHDLLYQPLAAAVAVVTVLAAWLLAPGSAGYLHAGDLRAPVTGLSWLGVGATDTWLGVGLTVGFVITGVTTLVVWLQAARSGRLSTRTVPLSFALALPFAALNAASEEAVFRLAPVTALGSVASMATVAILSGVLFGVPHYFGHPGKVPGALLAGFLGWLMCLSVLQTHGMLWAWGLHFVQDIVIFTLLFGVAATGVKGERASGAAAEPAARLGA